MSTPLAIACASLVAVLVASEFRERRALGAVAKVGASCCFVAQALVAGAADAGAVGTWALVALALCWLGDVMLLWRDRPRFLVGIVAFLLGHVAYVGAFATLGANATAAAATTIPLAAAGLVVLRVLWFRAGGLRGAVVAYVVVISSMVALAAGATGAGHGVVLLVGASLFYFSDLFVARDRFLARSPWNRALGLPLYYGGQLVLSAALPAAALAG